MRLYAYVVVNAEFVRRQITGRGLTCIFRLASRLCYPSQEATHVLACLATGQHEMHLPGFDRASIAAIMSKKSKRSLAIERYEALFPLTSRPLLPTTCFQITSRP